MLIALIRALRPRVFAGELHATREPKYSALSTAETSVASTKQVGACVASVPQDSCLRKVKLLTDTHVRCSHLYISVVPNST